MGNVKETIEERAGVREAAWDAWHRQKAEARRSWRRSCGKYVREKWDREIAEALAQARRGERRSAIRVNWALESILLAELELTARSGVLCASAATIAAKAGVSRRTVVTRNAELERLGILRRHSSGGVKLDGDGKVVAKASNVYRLAHQQLRRALGIPLRGQSKYDAPAPKSKTFGDAESALLLARERAAVSRFHVCPQDGSPWRDERGFARNYKTPKKISRRLYAMWKTPGLILDFPVQERVCTLYIDNCLKYPSQSKPYLSDERLRLQNGLAALRNRVEPRISAVVEKLSAVYPAFALETAVDALRLPPGEADALVLRRLATLRASLSELADAGERRPAAPNPPTVPTTVRS